MSLSGAQELARSRELLREATDRCHRVHVAQGELRAWWIGARYELTPEHREIVEAQLQAAGVRT